MSGFAQKVPAAGKQRKRRRGTRKQGKGLLTDRTARLRWQPGCWFLWRVLGYAFLAMSHRAAKATESQIAISESILRLISMPATFRPCMKVE